MTIIRDGKEIVLTDIELMKAYYEKEHQWDFEYIEQLVQVCYESNQLTEEEYNRILNDTEFRDKVAYKYRKYLDDVVTGDDEYNCFIDAYRYITEV